MHQWRLGTRFSLRYTAPDTVTTESPTYNRPGPTNSLRRVVWAQTAILLAVGLALIATVLTSYIGARRASETVVRGHGDSFLMSLAPRIFRAKKVDADFLNQLLEEHYDLGLRYIAIYENPDKIAVQAGERKAIRGPKYRRIPKPGVIVRVGDRIRMSMHRIPRRPRRWLNGGGEFAQRRRMPRFRPLVIEFDPLMARQLRANATRTLLVGCAAAAALLLAAFAFMRLARRAEGLRLARERERNLVSLGEMSAVLAHEIRNPLASLKGHAQLLGESLAQDERQRKKADRVVKEAVRIENIANGLLELAKSGRIDAVATDPRAVLADSVAQVGAEHFEIHSEQAPDSWRLDPLRMQQVLTNLLRNAEQASPTDKPAQASVSVERGRLVFAIRDFGPGIEAGQESRIFDAFHTKRVRGTGLGLAIAQRIVNLHGGTISASNHPEGGALFRVELPPQPPT